MWLLFALLSAITAALVAIFGKIGLSAVNPMLATAVRAVIMALATVIFAFSLGKFRGFTFAALSGGEWLWIVLAGLAGALSWIFYFYALQMGQATPVAAIDRLSMVFVLILAVIFLGEKLTWQSALGALFVVLGAILISWK
jgi:transporter family protein